MIKQITFDKQVLSHILEMLKIELTECVFCKTKICKENIGGFIGMGKGKPLTQVCSNHKCISKCEKKSWEGIE